MTTILLAAALAALPPAAATDSVDDLPLHLYATPVPADTMAIVLSGDGGWVQLVKDVTGVLQARGYPVVGLVSPEYFGRRRTAPETSADLARLMRHFMAAWGARHVVLIGYSRGADALPFMLDGLPADLRARIPVVGLVGIEHQMDFEFHLTSLFGSHTDSAVPIRPVLERLRGLPFVCVYGRDERDTLCPEVGHLATVLARDGGHHFDGDYAGIARDILARMR